MKYTSKKQKELFSHRVIFEVKNTVIAYRADKMPFRLSDYYQDIESETAEDQVRSAVRQLMQAHIHLKDDKFISDRKASLANEFEKANKFSHLKIISGAAIDQAVDAIDQSIVESLARQAIDNIAHGFPNASPGRRP